MSLFIYYKMDLKFYIEKKLYIIIFINHLKRDVLFILKVVLVILFYI